MYLIPTYMHAYIITYFQWIVSDLHSHRIFLIRISNISEHHCNSLPKFTHSNSNNKFSLWSTWFLHISDLSKLQNHIVLFKSHRSSIDKPYKFKISCSIIFPLFSRKSNRRGWTKRNADLTWKQEFQSRNVKSETCKSTKFQRRVNFAKLREIKKKEKQKSLPLQ